MDLDWIDIVLHVLGAIALTLMLLAGLHGLGWPLWLAPAINALFWAVREYVQDRNKGRVWPHVWPLRRSSQKDAEALAPAIAGVLICGAFNMVS